MNISKNHNTQNKLKFENSLNFHSLIEILLVNLNANLIYNLFMAFSYLTESKEIMGNIMYNELKQNNNFNENENNIFTMAGRTCKEQQEFIEIYSKNYLNKSRSVCSMDFNINNPMNTKNKFKRLNT